MGAGVAGNVDAIANPGAISRVAAGLAVTVPVVIYLLCLWVLHYRPEYRRTKWLGPIVAPVILLTSFSASPVLGTGVIMASVVALKIWSGPGYRSARLSS